MFINKEYIIKGEHITLTFAIDSLKRVKVVKGTQHSNAGFQAIKKLLSYKERESFLKIQREVIKASL